MFLMNAVAAHGARAQARRAARAAKLAVVDADKERKGWPSFESAQYYEEQYAVAVEVLSHCATQEVQAEKFFKKHRELLRENAPHLMNDLITFVALRDPEIAND